MGLIVPYSKTVFARGLWAVVPAILYWTIRTPANSGHTLRRLGIDLLQCQGSTFIRGKGRQLSVDQRRALVQPDLSSESL